DAVAFLALIELEGPVHAGDGGVLRRLVEDHDFVLAGERIADSRQHAAFDEALIGDDQRPCNAASRELGRQHPHRAKIEMHARELLQEAHQGTGLASIRMKATRAGLSVRFAQAWFVPRWIRTSPCFITFSPSSM